MNGPSFSVIGPMFLSHVLNKSYQDLINKIYVCCRLISAISRSNIRVI